MSFDYQHPAYRQARLGALARSGDVCQFCGQYPADETHHWARNYPSEKDTTPDDLTALCRVCHSTATALRQFIREGGDIFGFTAKLDAALIETRKERETDCDTNAKLRASLQSSCTPARDWTPESLPKSKSTKSPAGAGSEPPLRTNVSANSNAEYHYGLTAITQPSRPRPSDLP